MVQAGCTNYTNEEIGDVEQSYQDLITRDSSYIYNNIRGLAFSKLFLRSIIERNKLQFDEKMPLAEDLAFTLDYINYIDTVAFSSEVGYLYRRHPNSVTSKKAIRPYNVYLSCFYHLYNSINAYVVSHNIYGKDRLKREQHIGRNLFYTIYSLYQNKMCRKVRLHHLRKDFSQAQLSLLSSKPFGNGMKFLVTMPLIFGCYTIFDIVFLFIVKFNSLKG